MSPRILKLIIKSRMSHIQTTGTATRATKIVVPEMVSGNPRPVGCAGGEGGCGGGDISSDGVVMYRPPI